MKQFPFIGRTSESFGDPAESHRRELLVHNLAIFQFWVRRAVAAGRKGGESTVSNVPMKASAFKLGHWAGAWGLGCGLANGARGFFEFFGFFDSL
jgi:hypothetical protein